MKAYWEGGGINWGVNCFHGLHIMMVLVEKISHIFPKKYVKRFMMSDSRTLHRWICLFYTLCRSKGKMHALSLALYQYMYSSSCRPLLVTYYNILKDSEAYHTASDMAVSLQLCLSWLSSDVQPDVSQQKDAEGLVMIEIHHHVDLDQWSLTREWVNQTVWLMKLYNLQSTT